MELPFLADLAMSFIRGVDVDGETMDVVGMYMNAIYAAYDMCYMDKSGGITKQSWSLPQYQITITIDVVEVQFGIHGLRTFAEMLAATQMTPAIGGVLVKGVWKGDIVIIPRKRSLTSAQDIMTSAYNAKDMNALSGEAVNGLSLLGTVTNLGVELDIRQTFNGKKLSRHDALSTCLLVLMMAFHYFRNSTCLGMSMEPDFVIVSLEDDGGRPLLKYRHVIKAMRAIAAKMVELNQFEEMDIEIWQNGKQIAWGKLGNVEDQDGARVGTSINSTTVAVA